MAQFWMVFVDGGNAPAVKHLTEGEAVAEAQRLAKQTGCVASVLASKDRYVPIIDGSSGEWWQKRDRTCSNRHTFWHRDANGKTWYTGAMYEWRLNPATFTIESMDRDRGYQRCDDPRPDSARTRVFKAFNI